MKMDLLIREVIIATIVGAEKLSKAKSSYDPVSPTIITDGCYQMKQRVHYWCQGI